MGKVVIFGVGQSASRACWYLTHDSPYEVAAFTVDQDYIKEDKLFDLPVVPFEAVESLFSPSAYHMFLPINSTLPISPDNPNRLREVKYRQAKAKGYRLISYISSKATIWPGLVIGENCRILANSVVEPFARLGNDVMVGVGSLVSHHSVIEDHCSVIHHAVVLGDVTVKSHCFIGANATIRSGVTVARECVIGAGALILKDTQEREIHKGNPATLLPIPSDRLKKL
jgi:sugar O-acyltransferase (sialic acid O-acetyltransferase NeuD family)